MFLEPLVIGTTFSGSPSIFIIFAGLSSLTQKFPSLNFIEIFTKKLGPPRCKRESFKKVKQLYEKIIHS